MCLLRSPHLLPRQRAGPLVAKDAAQHLKRARREVEVVARLQLRRLARLLHAHLRARGAVQQLRGAGPGAGG
jgi:hypothetical protein